MIYRKVSFTDESEEFLRTATEMSPEEDIQVNFEFLKTMYQQALIKELDYEHWSTMENTDSWETDTIFKIQMAIKNNNEPRSISTIIHEFMTGTVRCPIVLEKEDGTYYLIAGNTRLMVAKYLKLTPKVVVIKTDW